MYDNTKSGASRVWNPFYPQGSDGGWFDIQQGSTEPPFIAQIGEISSFTRGLKAYEISNHLGNVLATVSDKKFGYGVDNAGVLTMSPTDENSYFQPEILSAQDYYAYGATKPGRRGSLKKNAEGNIAFVFDEAADVDNWRPLHDYRYAFNGKEADKKIWSEERVAYDYGFRIYYYGGFFSEDPLTKDYPELSPYHFAGSSPIQNSDLDGLEPVNMNGPGPRPVPRVGLRPLRFPSRQAAVNNRFYNRYLGPYSQPAPGTVPPIYNRYDYKNSRNSGNQAKIIVPNVMRGGADAVVSTGHGYNRPHESTNWEMVRSLRDMYTDPASAFKVSPEQIESEIINHANQFGTRPPRQKFPTHQEVNINIGGYDFIYTGGYGKSTSSAKGRFYIGNYYPDLKSSTWDAHRDVNGGTDILKK